MAVQIHIKTTPSFDKLRDKFFEFPDQVKSYLRIASQFGAFAVERESKPLTPVDTGRLRASIAVSLGIANQGLTSIVQTNTNYAVYVHEGTKYMTGRPFMEQGVEVARPAIESAYETQITKALQLLSG